jgi:outer membrane protein assembly factor BamA
LPACLALAAPLASGQDVGGLAGYAGKSVTEIAVAGLKSTREFVVRREIRTQAGRPLDLSLLGADLQRLDNLSIFAEMSVLADEDGAGVRLTFVLKEMPAWLPWPGFSYTEEDGFSGGAKLSALNVAGRAISMTAKAYVGGADQVSAKAAWPWVAGDHLSLELYAATIGRTDTLNEFKEKSLELTPAIGTYLGEHGRLEGKFSLFSMRSDVPGKTLSPDNTDDVWKLGLSVGWDTRDSWRSPRSGWLNEVEVWRVRGDGRFWSLDVDLQRWFAIGRKQKLFVNSLASLQSGTAGEDVPVYLQHRLGGANSIRGYDIEVLGRTLHGKSEWLGTAEYSVSLIPLRRWNIWKFALRMGADLAFFGDLGVAWDEESQLRAQRARGGGGAGLRLLVPGSEMVRLDVGWSKDGGFHFHFASGTKPLSQRQRIR